MGRETPAIDLALHALHGSAWDVACPGARSVEPPETQRSPSLLAESRRAVVEEDVVEPQLGAADEVGMDVPLLRGQGRGRDAVGDRMHLDGAARLEPGQEGVLRRGEFR